MRDLFYNHPVPLLLIKLAALGNLKASFHCAHLHSFFPLKRAPPLISVFSPQGRRGNRSSSSLVTISFYGWRTIRGLRQQQSCSFLCGDEPAFTQGLGCGLLDRCSMLAECSLDAGWLGLGITAKVIWRVSRSTCS